MKLLKQVSTFLFMCLLGAFIMYMSGVDLDHRTANTGIGTTLIFIIALASAYLLNEENR